MKRLAVTTDAPLIDATPAERYSVGASAPTREPLLADEQRHALGDLAPKKQYRPFAKKRLAFRESSSYADSGRGGPSNA